MSVDRSFWSEPETALPPGETTPQWYRVIEILEAPGDIDSPVKQARLEAVTQPVGRP